MKNLKLVLCAGAASLGLTFASAAIADEAPSAPAAAPAAPAPMPTPPPYPSFTGPLSNNANSATFDAGPFGKLTVNGVVTGLGYAQDQALHTPSDKDASFDINNGMAMVQKTDGVFQFYVQAGVYSFMSLGTPYLKSSSNVSTTFGAVPVAFVKIAPTSSFNIIAGQIPTLIGAEYTFSYENMNIIRGLLWNQEPAISRGVQANYSQGPITLALSVNDGFYSKYLSTISALGTFQFTMADSISLVGSWNTSHKLKATSATPVASIFDDFGDSVSAPLQNVGDVYNIIYTHNSGPWTITPYFQYTHTPADIDITGLGGFGFGGFGGFGGLGGFGGPLPPSFTVHIPSASTWGVALLAKYSFTPEFSIAARGEYISSSNPTAACSAPALVAGTTPCHVNLLYGPGSNAWSLTVTPTYQKGIFFVRGELAYTSIGSGTLGFMLGPNADKSSQVRGAVETGFLF